MKIGDVFLSKLSQQDGLITPLYGIMRCINDGKLSNSIATCIVVYTGSKKQCENVLEKYK